MPCGFIPAWGSWYVFVFMKRAMRVAMASGAPGFQSRGLSSKCSTAPERNASSSTVLSTVMACSGQIASQRRHCEQSAWRWSIPKDPHFFLVPRSIFRGDVRVIWFEVGQHEDTISLFTRLNIGKIPLPGPTASSSNTLPAIGDNPLAAIASLLAASIAAAVALFARKRLGMASN